MHRRLAAIIAVDMVGYSKIMDADPPRAIRMVTALRERWLEPKATAQGGDVVKRMGDGWLIAFASAQNAVETALAVQHDLSGQTEIALRIAVHLGELVDDGTDVYGTGINIASRLQAEAPPGGVMISQDIHRQIDPALAAGFADAGTLALRNIAQPVAVYRWRPERPGRKPADTLPVIAVERVTAPPGSATLAAAADDLAEQLVHRLSRRTGVRVRAGLPAPDDGAPATYLLRGSLRPRGGAVRLTLTLMRQADGGVIWSDVYEAPDSAVADLCDSAAEQADADLRLEINAFDADRVASLPDEDLGAAELRTRAAQLIYGCTLDTLTRARGLVERALTLDPDNGMSLAMWVEIATMLALAAPDDPDDATLRLIASRADRAVQAMPRSDYVFCIRAQVRCRLIRNLDGARHDIARVDRINPDYAMTLEARALLSMAEGHHDDAVRDLRRRIDKTRRDPYMPAFLYTCAIALLKSGRPAEAAVTLRDAIDLHADCRAYWQLLADALTAAVSPDQAAEAARVAAGLPDRPDPQAMRITLNAF